MLKALADPVRLRLVTLVRPPEGARRASATSPPHFDLSQPTISHHLKVLHEAGLLDREKRGMWVYYIVRPEAMTALGSLFTADARCRCRRMSDAVRETAARRADDAVLERLSTLDRFLPVWIVVAMVARPGAGPLRRRASTTRWTPSRSARSACRSPSGCC